MNTSNAFRSHLMQQFISQARAQRSPPLALLGILSDENEKQKSGAPAQAMASQGSSSHLLNNTSLSSIDTTGTFSLGSNVRRRHTDSEITCSSSGHIKLVKKFFSTNNLQESDGFLEDEESDHSSSRQSGTGVVLSEAFQTLLQTRRTSSRLVSLPELPPLYEHEEDFWIDALDRAVQCGYQAPNHRRTEPFTFKRMMAPSAATDRLAEIAYHVDLRKQLLSFSSDPKGVVGDSSDEDKNCERALAFQHARNKRDKWSQIPAFLVTTVTEEEMVVHSDREAVGEYDSLPYIPPQTERALEDYASACAAVQNVLLSLHSEHIATKWVTGAVVQTPAFRELVHLEPSDRVVALIMVGAHPDVPKKAPRRRKNRRSLYGDVLVDL